MALRPLSETGTVGKTAADKPDAAHRALSVLDTAEQVARKTLEEARDEAQRLIAQAQEEAARIRAKASGDAPDLQRVTAQLRVEQHRTLTALEGLRNQLGSLLDAHQAGTHISDG
jgi:cell division septum initiation protein DivIVA